VPTYQYACTQCNHRFEAVQAFTDDSLTVCPECGGSLRKVYGSVGVVFKGSGFYRTDSRAGAISPAAGSEKAAGDKAGGDKAGGDKKVAASTGSDSGGSKPAATAGAGKGSSSSSSSSSGSGSGSAGGSSSSKAAAS
jgi:putative FmdB family regulatory protein